MKFGILLARQRSGTGALGSVLDRHQQIKYLGEIFHPDNVGQEDNYFTHLAEWVKEEPERALPWKNKDNLEDYVAFAESKYKGQIPIIDIKYRSLHHLNSGWQGLADIPWVIKYARDNNLPIIHLTRKNFVESFVSGRLAEENKVWHTSDEKAATVKSVTVNIRKLSNYITAIEREVELIDRWTRGYKNLIHIEYADMFDETGAVKKDIGSELSKTLGVKAFTDFEPAFVKQAPSHVSESLENFDLVKTALTGTKYAWMLE